MTLTLLLLLRSICSLEYYYCTLTIVHCTNRFYLFTIGPLLHLKLKLCRKQQRQRHTKILTRLHTQKGDKILLPPSAFDMLARLQVDYPMLFRLTGTANQRTTHSGVLEFTAEEGCVYIPHWMMQNLLLEEGSLVSVTNVSLPKATFVKLQPQSTDFLEISNPRAVLEHALRNFSCVTVHDIIQIPYNNKNYHFELKEVQPGPAACIIETDCNVDFDAPVGYVEPERPQPQQQAMSSNSSSSKRSSACPSPDANNNNNSGSNNATTSGAVAWPSGEASLRNASAQQPQPEEPPFRGVRIVNGAIVRPEDPDTNTTVITDLLADRTGATGVQRNAAIPQAAPESSYWAVVAGGEGARLDGKAAAALRDAKTGQILNVPQLRADAAARRHQQQQEATPQFFPGGNGANSVPATDKQEQQQQESSAQATTTAASTVVSKRNSRVGSKYSKLKSGSNAAFQGLARPMQDEK